MAILPGTLPRPYQIIAAIGAGGVTRGYPEYDVTADEQKFLAASNAEQSTQPIRVYDNWSAGLKK